MNLQEKITRDIMSGKSVLVYNQNQFNLPEPQRSGTATQQRAYAYQKAGQIVQIIKDNGQLLEGDF